MRLVPTRILIAIYVSVAGRLGRHWNPGKVCDGHWSSNHCPIGACCLQLVAVLGLHTCRTLSFEAELRARQPFTAAVNPNQLPRCESGTHQHSACAARCACRRIWLGRISGGVLSSHDLPWLGRSHIDELQVFVRISDPPGVSRCLWANGTAWEPRPA